MTDKELHDEIASLRTALDNEVHRLSDQTRLINECMSMQGQIFAMLRMVKTGRALTLATQVLIFTTGAGIGFVAGHIHSLKGF